jgi:hypothetical protein
MTGSAVVCRPLALVRSTVRMIRVFVPILVGAQIVLTLGVSLALFATLTGRKSDTSRKRETTILIVDLTGWEGRIQNFAIARVPCLHRFFDIRSFRDLDRLLSQSSVLLSPPERKTGNNYINKASFVLSLKGVCGGITQEAELSCPNFISSANLICFEA